jgi:thiamine pyrophosphokinase
MPEQAPEADAVIVFTGGDAVPDSALLDLPDDALVIAADSGLQHALAAGIAVDLVVGDFDSVDGELLAAAEAAGARIERHPEAKDETDFELALDRAAATGARSIVVLGGHGGRFDHFLANALVLASPGYSHIDVEARFAEARVRVIRGQRTFAGHPGELLTLLPVHGPAVGVTTSGLLYPLWDETLEVGSTRGVSNELAASTATVTVRAGVLLAVRPGRHGTHFERGIQADDSGAPRTGAEPEHATNDGKERQ